MQLRLIFVIATAAAAEAAAVAEGRWIKGEGLGNWYRLQAAAKVKA